MSFVWRTSPAAAAATASFLLLAPVLSLLALVGGGNQPLKNAGFESATPADSWRVDLSEAKQDFSLIVDQVKAKEGKQSLLVAAVHPANLTLRQEVFLPVGTLWRFTGWVKSTASRIWGVPIPDHESGLKRRLAIKASASPCPPSASDGGKRASCSVFLPREELTSL